MSFKKGKVARTLASRRPHSRRHLLAEKTLFLVLEGMVSFLLRGTLFSL